VSITPTTPEGPSEGGGSSPSPENGLESSLSQVWLGNPKTKFYTRHRRFSVGGGSFSFLRGLENTTPGVRQGEACSGQFPFFPLSPGMVFPPQGGFGCSQGRELPRNPYVPGRTPALCPNLVLDDPVCFIRHGEASTSLRRFAPEVLLRLVRPLKKMTQYPAAFVAFLSSPGWLSQANLSV